MAIEDYFDFDTWEEGYDDYLESTQPHNMGYWKVVRESSKAVLCEFIGKNHKKNKKPGLRVKKWQPKPMRWVPKSQIMPPQIPKDIKSLTSESKVGTVGILWISNYLKKSWSRNNYR